MNFLGTFEKIEYQKLIKYNFDNFLFNFCKFILIHFLILTIIFIYFQDLDFVWSILINQVTMLIFNFILWEWQYLYNYFKFELPLLFLMNRKQSFGFRKFNFISYFICLFFINYNNYFLNLIIIQSDLFIIAFHLFPFINPVTFYHKFILFLIKLYFFL